MSEKKSGFLSSFVAVVLTSLGLSTGSANAQLSQLVSDSVLLKPAAASISTAKKETVPKKLPNEDRKIPFQPAVVFSDLSAFRRKPFSEPAPKPRTKARV